MKNVLAFIVFLLGLGFIVITITTTIIDNEGLFSLGILIGLAFIFGGLLIANLNPNNQ